LYRRILDGVVTALVFVMVLMPIGALAGLVMDFTVVAGAFRAVAANHKLAHGLVYATDRELIIDLLSVFVLIEPFRTFTDYLDCQRGSVHLTWSSCGANLLFAATATSRYSAKYCEHYVSRILYSASFRTAFSVRRCRETCFWHRPRDDRGRALWRRAKPATAHGYTKEIIGVGVSIMLGGVLFAGCTTVHVPSLSAGGMGVRQIDAEQSLSCQYLRNVAYVTTLSGIEKNYERVHEAGVNGLRNAVADIGGNAYVSTRIDADVYSGHIYFAGHAFLCRRHRYHLN
jgi:hypothetical protein